MRIVGRDTFLALPEGTVYQKYEPCVFGELSIKRETRGNDWWYDTVSPWFEDTRDSGEYFDTLVEAQRTGGETPKLDFDCPSRDGCFDEGQLFAVWSAADVRGLVRALNNEPPER